ncbi:MAG TPA: monovalent cation/H+ antiporter subunit D, partial [Pseudomonas sp.]|nr:monovalent cation/H+ antiporter subunit D [Pseudomonas sp.]
MNHALIMPILLPLLVGCSLLLIHRRGASIKRLLSVTATWLLVPLALWLAWQANAGELSVYRLGDWRPPFGIML